MAQGKIEATITAKDTSQGVFKNLGMNLVALNQSVELVNKAIGALRAPFDALVSEGRKFGAQMSAVRAISKTTAGEFQKLTDEAKRIGETTAFTAVQAGEAMEELRRAGLGVNNTLTTTSQAMDLAAATGADLGTAARVVAVNMKVFAKENLDAKKAVDLMVQTVGASPQNFENLTGALETSGGTAAAVGIPFEQMTHIFGAMAEAGVRGEKAGTALNGAISRLLNPSSEAVKVLDKYNLTVEQLNPANQEFADILDTLNGANMTQADLLKLLGQEVAPKFFKVIEGGGDSLRNFSKAQKEANTASEAAAQRLDNLEGDITIFQSAVSGIKLTIFDSLNLILRDIVQGGTSMVNVFTEFVKQHQDTITVIFQNIVEAIKAVGGGIIFLIRSFGSLLRTIAQILKIEAVINLFNAIQKVFNVIIDEGIKPLIRLFKELSDDAFGELNKSGSDINEIFSTIVTVVAEIITVIGKALPVIFRLSRIVIRLISRAMKPLAASFVKIIDLVKGPFLKILKLLGKGFDLVNDITKDFEETLTGNTLSVSLEVVAENLDSVGKRLENFGKETKKADKEAAKLDKTLKDVQTTMKETAAAPKIPGVGGGIQLPELPEAKDVKGGALAAIRGVGSIFSRLIDSILNLFKSNEKFSAALNEVFSTFQQAIAPAIEAFIPVLKAIASGIKDSAPFFKDLVRDLGPLIKQLITIVTRITKALQPIMQEVISRFIPILEKMIAQLGPILVEIIEALGPLISALLDIINPITEALIPIIREILVLVKELIPVITAILEVIKPFVPIIVALVRIVAALLKIIVGVLVPIIQFLVNVIKTLAAVITIYFGVLAAIFEQLGAFFNNLISAIEDLVKALGAGIGGGGGGVLGALTGGLGKAFGFQSGSEGLTRDQLLRLPGMEAGAGLVKAHVGEQIIPNSNNVAAGMNIVFHVKSINPQEQVEEIRQVLEQLSLSGKLRFAQ
jgi:TP901 family phage tail tape measure protein